MITFASLDKIIEKASLSKGQAKIIGEPFIYFNQAEDVLAEYIRHSLSTHGYSFIRTRNLDNSNKIMQLIANLRGPLQKQNQKGLADIYIYPIKGATRYINTCSAQPLHTDNGYSSQFPSTIALRCIKKATTGGETLLVNVNPLLNYLYKSYPIDIELLYQSDAITYINGSSSVKKSIFRYSVDMKNQISFSIFADEIVGKSDKIEELYIAIVDFVHHQNNQMQLLLDDNDILIVDNLTMLHGRKSFAGDRLLIRTWYSQ